MVKKPTKMNYNKQSYRLILQTTIDQGFEFVDFLTVNLDEDKRRQIILRHDIDFSPAMALEMAEIDATYKIKSTFALLLSSPLYNPFTFAGIKNVNEIQQLGHNIALHHRVAPGRTAEEIGQDIVREMQVMKAFFPYIQPVFLWHNLPSNNLLSNIEVPGMVNAYGTKFTHEMHYISDSVTRHTPEEFISVLGTRRLIHMLLHPLIWMSEKGSMVAMISHALTKIILECDKEFILNPAWKQKFPDGIPEEFLDNLEKSLSEG